MAHAWNGAAKMQGTLPDNRNNKPWESAPVPEVEHLYECEFVGGWHDEAHYSGDELYWYEGDREYPAAWLCEGCHFHIRNKRYGFDSPEMRGLYRDLETTPTLAQEIKRRLGEGMWEWRPLQATHK